MVLAETEEKALEIAPPRLPALVGELHALWHKHNMRRSTSTIRPRSTARSPTAAPSPPRRPRRCDILRAQLAESGANYLVCRFAFGDLSLRNRQRSLELFQRHVMPALRESVSVAAE